MNIEVMKARLKRMEKDYYNKHVFGNLSDLLADIVALKVKIERAEGLENDERGEDQDGNLDDA